MNDLELRKAIEDELSYEPTVNAACIGVSVKDSIVSLSGSVDTYSELAAAERAAMRIRGVKAVVRGLKVRLPGYHERTDEDIARAAANALAWSTLVPKDRIKVEVSNGWVTFEGEVGWKYQSRAAEDLIRNLVGVKGITNNVLIEPFGMRDVVKHKIEDALKRSAEIDAQHITVTTAGDRVILAGTVRSWFEREQAELAAWAAAGVRSVENRIEVGTLTLAEV